MNGKILVTSAGGVGDSLICAIKLQKSNINPVNIDWKHFEKHEQHKAPIESIMEETLPLAQSQCIICDTPEKNSQELIGTEKRLYVDTKIVNLTSPYLTNKIGNKYKTFGHKPHIVINLLSGRLNDSTRRSVDRLVVENLAKTFNDRYVVLLSPELLSKDSEYEECFKLDNVLNHTGTDNIIDAISCINNAALTISQDGILGYYSCAIRKPTIIHFHSHTLVNHYFNLEWGKHCIAMCGNGNNFKDLDVNHPETQALFDIVRSIK